MTTPDIDIHSLSQRLRSKALLMLDVDPDFSCDLICASYLLDDMLVSQPPAPQRLHDEIAPCTR
jgi:hypothetical protein